MFLNSSNAFNINTIKSSLGFIGYYGAIWGDNNLEFSTHPSNPTGDLNFRIGLDKALTIKNTSRNVGIGTDNPSEALDVNGNINTNGKLLANGVAGTNGQTLTSDASGNISWQSNSSSDNDWIESGNNIYRLTGKVGIGESMPNNALTVKGQANDNQSVITATVNSTNSTNFDIPAIIGFSNYLYSNNGSTSNKGSGGNFEGGRQGISAFVPNTSNQNGLASYGGYLYNRSGGSGSKYGLYSFVGQEGTGFKYGVYGAVVSEATTPGRYGVYGKSPTSGGSTWAGYFAGNLHYTGTLNGVSDKKLKKNINKLSNQLPKVLKLNPTTYVYKNEEKNFMNLATGKQIGFIAQEVEKIFPELVSEDIHNFTNSNDGISNTQEIIKSLNYIGLIPVLTSAIQEQQKLINSLQNDLKVQSQKLELLESKIERSLNIK